MDAFAASIYHDDEMLCSILGQAYTVKTPHPQAFLKGRHESVDPRTPCTILCISVKPASSHAFFEQPSKQVECPPAPQNNPHITNLRRRPDGSLRSLEETGHSRMSVRGRLMAEFCDDMRRFKKVVGSNYGNNSHTTAFKLTSWSNSWLQEHGRCHDSVANKNSSAYIINEGFACTVPTWQPQQPHALRAQLTVRGRPKAQCPAPFSG